MAHTLEGERGGAGLKSKKKKKKKKGGSSATEKRSVDFPLYTIYY